MANSGGKVWPGLRPDQVVIGLPANSDAGNGFVAVSDTEAALDCLMKGICSGYQPHQVTPNLRGLMAWSINWDAYTNYSFSVPYKAYFAAYGN